MGYLYTLEDIRLGRVPTRADFVHMRGVVEDALQKPHFLAASLFGSLPRGDWTLRSDIDVMAITRAADHDAARAEIQSLTKLASDRRIRLSAHLHTVSEARRGEHPFDSSHRLTMRELVAEGRAKGLPHQWYLCPGQNIRPDMLNRLCRVLASTSDASHRFKLIRDDREVDAWIKRSWDQGVRPMRLYLGFVRWLMWWQHQAPFPDGKEEVIEAFLRDETFKDFHQTVIELRTFDDEYDTLFNEARSGHVNEHDYQRCVRTLISRALATSVGIFSHAIGKLGAVLAQSNSPQLAA
ncbi:nucleotidyltransferase domain-containing protein [Candidatus Uhrbacteria bacterium]|nr:nucleotidyltransferase domain-containing protein [Candidatus Uhrbacteria bacterium]